MALTQEEITTLLTLLPNNSYKAALSNAPVKLSEEIALALGQNKRNLVRVLSTVVDAIADKLFVKSMTFSDTMLQQQTEEWLAANKWELLERKLYRYAVRDGKSYALVSYKNNAPSISVLELYDGKQGAIVLYSDKDTSVPLLGVNTWYSGTDRYLDVYYDNRIEKYLYNGYEWTKRTDYEGESWPVDFTDENNAPLGIPLIEYSIGESDLADGAVQIQKDINEALLDLMAVNRTMGYLIVLFILKNCEVN